MLTAVNCSLKSKKASGGQSLQSIRSISREACQLRGYAAPGVPLRGRSTPRHSCSNQQILEKTLQITRSFPGIQFPVLGAEQFTRPAAVKACGKDRSEEHTSELQSL